MTPISTRLHGKLDYLLGILLILSPWIFNFSQGKAATWIPMILGAVMILYSFCTHYEAGALKIFYMRTHLVFDIVSGIFLAVSPLVFRFYNNVYTPHLWLGIGLVVTALLTSARPYARKNPHGDMTKYAHHIPKQYQS